jgi:CRISPR system Cascade subunit CasD
MKALILRLDAPMMSFGGVMVDQHGFIDRFPGTAMLCGLVANALGWNHDDFAKLQDLQDRIVYAARWDTSPKRLVDYHTVDLGQPKMVGYAKPEKRGDPKGGWTTRGTVEWRDGASGLGTHQRYRHYWIDGLMTIALGLKGTHGPDLEQVKDALLHPARPLFIGRKTCLPARPLLDPDTPVMEGEDILAILCQVSVIKRAISTAQKCEACWPADVKSHYQRTVRRVYDLRDWANGIPAGSTMRAEGLIEEVRYATTAHG